MIDTQPINPVIDGQVRYIKISIIPGTCIQISSYVAGSFTIENIGSKRTTASYFDVADARFARLSF